MWLVGPVCGHLCCLLFEEWDDTQNLKMITIALQSLCENKTPDLNLRLFGESQITHNIAHKPGSSVSGS